MTRADVVRAAAIRDRAATPVAAPPPGLDPGHLRRRGRHIGVVALRDRHAPPVGNDRDSLTLTAFVVDAVGTGAARVPPAQRVDRRRRRSRPPRGRQHIGVTVDTDRVRRAGHQGCRRPEPARTVPADRRGHGPRRSRRRSLPDDLPAGTFTVTNTGSRGVLFDTPILVPGQVGIVGTGDIVERAVVVRRPDGERAIAIRSMAYLGPDVRPPARRRRHGGQVPHVVKARLQGERSPSELS